MTTRALEPVLEPVLGPALPAPRVEELVARRSVASRLRTGIGRAEAVTPERTLYWPIALVRATARSTGRRQWVERVSGAVDLVTGRVGLVDVELPPLRDCSLPDVDRIPARFTRSAAELLWHESFRDHVDRRHKPLRPPTLSLDAIERVWLPHHLALAGGRRFLVDALTGRVQAAADVPAVTAVLERAGLVSRPGQRATVTS